MRNLLLLPLVILGAGMIEVIVVLNHHPSSGGVNSTINSMKNIGQYMFYGAISVMIFIMIIAILLKIYSAFKTSDKTNKEGL